MAAHRQLTEEQAMRDKRFHKAFTLRRLAKIIPQPLRLSSSAPAVALVDVDPSQWIGPCQVAVAGILLNPVICGSNRRIQRSPQA